MLTLGVAALACLSLSDALRHLPTPDLHYHNTDKTAGGNGYKLFDSFHKKDGDSFGFEKHSVFGDGDRGKDGSYHRTSSYDSGNHKPKSVSYHYESKLGTPKDYSNYDPETYEGDYPGLASSKLTSHTPTKPFLDEFSKPLRGESCQSLGMKKSMPSLTPRGRKYGTFDSAENDEDAEFGFYDDVDVEGSFEGEFFSGETDTSFETDDSGENEASFY